MCESGQSATVHQLRLALGRLEAAVALHRARMPGSAPAAPGLEPLLRHLALMEREALRLRALLDAA